jgi:hypothetical protein
MREGCPLNPKRIFKNVHCSHRPDKTSKTKNSFLSVLSSIIRLRYVYLLKNLFIVQNSKCSQFKFFTYQEVP